MAGTGKCVCGHRQAQHIGLERQCLALVGNTQCNCPYFSIATAPTTNSVDRPPHYTSHPSGVEAITVCEHMSFNVGNAVKYLWRAGLKGDALIDLKKSLWYVQREIERLGKAK